MDPWAAPDPAALSPCFPWWGRVEGGVLVGREGPRGFTSNATRLPGATATSPTAYAQEDHRHTYSTRPSGPAAAKPASSPTRQMIRTSTWKPFHPMSMSPPPQPIRHFQNGRDDRQGPHAVSATAARGLRVPAADGTPCLVPSRQERADLLRRDKLVRVSGSRTGPSAGPAGIPRGRETCARLVSSVRAREFGRGGRLSGAGDVGCAVGAGGAEPHASGGELCGGRCVPVAKIGCRGAGEDACETCIEDREVSLPKCRRDPGAYPCTRPCTIWSR